MSHQDGAARRLEPATELGPIAPPIFVELTHSPVDRDTQAGTALPLHGSDNIFVRDRSGLQRITISGIRLLRAEGNYVEVIAERKRFVLRNSMREVLGQLKDDRFQQVNRNTVVNISRLERVDCDSVEVDGVTITLSRNFREPLVKRLHVLSGR